MYTIVMVSLTPGGPGGIYIYRRLRGGGGPWEIGDIGWFICILCCDRYNVREEDIWIQKGK